MSAGAFTLGVADRRELFCALAIRGDRMRVTNKLTSGLVLMMRHRAKNYSAVLRDDRASDLTIQEMRNLLYDIVGPDEIMELTNCWLKAKEASSKRKTESAA